MATNVPDEALDGLRPVAGLPVFIFIWVGMIPRPKDHMLSLMLEPLKMSK